MSLLTPSLAAKPRLACVPADHHALPLSNAPSAVLDIHFAYESRSVARVEHLKRGVGREQRPHGLRMVCKGVQASLWRQYRPEFDGCYIDGQLVE